MTANKANNHHNEPSKNSTKSYHLFLTTNVLTALTFLSISITTKSPDNVQFCASNFKLKHCYINIYHDFNNCESNGTFNHSLDRYSCMRLLPYYCNIQRKNDDVSGRQNLVIACSF